MWSGGVKQSRQVSSLRHYPARKNGMPIIWDCYKVDTVHPIHFVSFVSDCGICWRVFMKEKKRPNPKNKRFAPPLAAETMDDLLKATVKTQPKPRKMSPLQCFKKIKW